MTVGFFLPCSSQDFRTADRTIISHPPLGELELELLERLWERGEGDAKSLHAALAAHRHSGLNTVQSALERLYRKGLLERQKRSHAFVYAPALAREELLGSLIGGLVARLGGGSPEAMLQAFVGCTARVDPSALERLEALAAERRREDHAE